MDGIIITAVLAFALVGGGLWMGWALRDDRAEMRWRAAYARHLVESYGNGEGR